MKRFIYATIAAAAALSSSPCTAFIAPSTIARPLSQISSSNTDEAPKLVDQSSYQAAIDILKSDMGIEIIPPSQRPMYAIGRLVSTLPLEMASGIRLADCDTLTLISQIQTRVVEATGIQSLDTIVSIRAGEYVGDTCQKKIGEVARVYTDAINYAMENQLSGIELEVNRLVPLRAAEDGAGQSGGDESA
jgi:hypothetical protein